jgi:hypothetical protein
MDGKGRYYVNQNKPDIQKDKHFMFSILYGKFKKRHIRRLVGIGKCTVEVGEGVRKEEGWMDMINA